MAGSPAPAPVTRKPLDQIAREVITIDPDGARTSQTYWLMCLGVIIGQDMRNTLTQVRQELISTRRMSGEQLLAVIDEMIKSWDDACEPDFESTIKGYIAKANESSGERPVVMNELGALLRRMGRLQAACDCLSESVALCKKDDIHKTVRKDTFTIAMLNLAGVYTELMLFDKVEELYTELSEFMTQQLLIDGVSATRSTFKELMMLQYDWSLKYFMEGNFHDGAIKWEGRFHRGNVQDAMTPNAYNTPRYADQGLAGKDILVWTEQGIGDELLMLTILPDLLEAIGDSGGHVTLLVTQRLVPIVRRNFPNITVDIRKTPLPSSATRDHDFQMNFADLMKVFRPDKETFRAATTRNGALFPCGAHSKDILHGYKETSEHRKPIIGISWRSSNPEAGNLKSSLLADWLPILQVPNCTFVSLQYGPVADEVRMLNTCNDIDLQVPKTFDAMQDLEAFESLVRSCDLVISVSNTTVHFAGALGVHCWLIVPRFRGRFWYWGTSDRQCLWYESVMISRPEMRADAEDLEDRPAHIAKIADQLATWVDSYHMRHEPTNFELTVSADGPTDAEQELLASLIKQPTT